MTLGRNTKMQTIDQLKALIDKRSVIVVTYDGQDRVMEPYLIHRSAAGNTILHGWQVSGAFTKTPPPDWANLSLHKISDIKDTGETFEKPHSGFNRYGEKFGTVVHSL